MAAATSHDGVLFEAQPWTTPEAEERLAQSPGTTSVALAAGFPFEVRPIIDALGPNVTSIDIGGAREALNPDVQALVERCPALEAISLKDCFQLGDAAVIAVAQAAGPVLRRLRLDGLGEVTDAGVFALRQCVMLEELSLAGLRTVGAGSLSYVLQLCPDLRALDLSECQVTDDLLNALASSRPPLQRLSLAGCRMVTSVGVFAALRACPALRALSLHNCPRLTDEALAAVAAFLPELEELDVGWNDNISDVSLQAVLQRCKRVRALRVAGCRGLSSRAMLHVAMLAGRRLAELDLLRCERLSDNGIRCIAEKCPALTSLRIGFCCRLTDESVRALGAGPRCLTDLDLSNMRLLSDDALAAALASTAPSLARLNLYSCGRLTDEAARHVAACAGLRRLVLSFVGELSDEGLLAVARGCPALEELEVASCRLLTDAALAAAVRLLPRLAALGAAGVRLLTDAALDAMGPPLAALDVRDCNRVTRDGAERLRARLAPGAVVRTSHWGGPRPAPPPPAGEPPSEPSGLARLS